MELTEEIKEMIRDTGDGCILVIRMEKDNGREDKTEKSGSEAEGRQSIT